MVVKGATGMLVGFYNTVLSDITHGSTHVNKQPHWYIILVFIHTQLYHIYTLYQMGNYFGQHQIFLLEILKYSSFSMTSLGFLRKSPSSFKVNYYRIPNILKIAHTRTNTHTRTLIWTQTHIRVRVYVSKHSIMPYNRHIESRRSNTTPKKRKLIIH